MENENDNPGNEEKQETPAQKEARRRRFVYRQKLVSGFFKAMHTSSDEFTWQDKADFLEVMIQYVTLVLKKEDSQVLENFVTEKILKVFRSKLQITYRVKLFKYFAKDQFGTGLEMIAPEIFKDIEVNEWVLSDAEYEQLLMGILHGLKMDLEMHLIFGKTLSPDETETEPEALAGIPGLKGRMPRAPGDNFTRLSQEQTALFIELLRFGRVILSDQYLNAKQAGLAFNILTGYNADGLRMKLNKKELVKLKTRDNLTEILNTLTRLSVQIDADLKEFKRPKGS